MVMKSVEAGNIVLGEGSPKICVSLIGRTEQELLREVRLLKTLPAHMVEWRVDRFEGALDIGRVYKTLAVLRKEIKAMPILFTFRTLREGGEKEIDMRYYEHLNRGVAGVHMVDLIDIEIFSGDEIVGAVITEAHKHGVKVMGSNHDFDKTPSKEEIIRRLREMQQMGVDITKIAVMPNCKKDVLILMEAIIEMKEQYADRPIVAMSMGEEGRISRLAGEFFGSSITFGASEKASAPGQIQANRLRMVLDIIHKG